MRVLVLGGQLQGTEIACLAKEAGWEVLVVDMNADALASQICDEFFCVDIMDTGFSLLPEFDLLFPATENVETLRFAQEYARQKALPFVFDENAFMLSRSKILTNRFLQGLGVSIPPLIDNKTPEGIHGKLGFLVKPDSSSGSKGVRYFSDVSAARAYIKTHEDVFGQVFFDGPLYSLEVIGNGKAVTTYTITEVIVGLDYDCFRIVAPAEVPAEVRNEIENISLSIGHALGIQGIFDVELVLHNSRLYVLEIDARMPSQTPLAIYHATGVNLVVEAARCHIDLPTEERSESDGQTNSAVLQHVCIEGDRARLIGEGELLQAPPLHRFTNLFETEVALISEDREHGRFYATLVTRAPGKNQAQQKMYRAVEQLTADTLSPEKGFWQTCSERMCS